MDGFDFQNANLKTIGDYAFAETTAVGGQITLPASITSIGLNAFYNVTYLQRDTTFTALFKVRMLEVVFVDWDGMPPNSSVTARSSSSVETIPIQQTDD